MSTREQECGTLIEWIKSNISTTQFIPLRREEIAEKAGISLSNAGKGLFQLIEKNYLAFDQRKNEPGQYQLIKDLSTVTGAELDLWIKEHQRISDRKRKAKLKALQGGHTAPTNNTPLVNPIWPAPGQTQLPLAPAQEFQMTQEKTEPQPTPQKSRSQQLLDEAERLRQEAEKEAQREEEEAKKASEAPEPMPGTTPDLLMMLDSRIDAMEGRINAVVSFFEQASIALKGLAAVGPQSEPAQTVHYFMPEPAPAVEPTTRTLLVRLVNSYAAATQKSEHDTWKWLYGCFDLERDFNVYAVAGPLAKGKDESYLNVFEQQGKIEDLYRYAKGIMKLKIR